SKRRSAPPSGRAERPPAPTSSASSRSNTTAPGSANTPSSGTSPRSRPEPGCSKTSPPQRKNPLSRIRGELHLGQLAADATQFLALIAGQRARRPLAPVGPVLLDPASQPLGTHTQLPGDLGDVPMRRGPDERDRVPLELGRVPLAHVALATHDLGCFLRDSTVPVSGCPVQRGNFTGSRSCASGALRVPLARVGPHGDHGNCSSPESG